MLINNNKLILNSCQLLSNTKVTKYYKSLPKVKKAIFKVILSFAYRYNKVFPKQELIAKKAKCSLRHVSNTLKEFNESGIILKKNLPWRSCLYELHPYLYSKQFRKKCDNLLPEETKKRLKNAIKKCVPISPSLISSFPNNPYLSKPDQFLNQECYITIDSNVIHLKKEKMNQLHNSIIKEFSLDRQASTEISKFSDLILKKAELETRKRTDLNNKAAYFMTICRKEHIKKLTESASGNKQLEQGELRNDQIMPPDGKPLLVRNWNIAVSAKERTREELQLKIDEESKHVQKLTVEFEKKQDQAIQRRLWQMEASLLNWKKALALTGETQYQPQVNSQRKDSYSLIEIANEISKLSKVSEIQNIEKATQAPAKSYKNIVIANMAYGQTFYFEEPAEPTIEDKIAIGYIQEWREKLIDYAPKFYKQFKYRPKMNDNNQSGYNPQEDEKDSPQVKLDPILIESNPLDEGYFIL